MVLFEVAFCNAYYLPISLDFSERTRRPCTRVEILPSIKVTVDFAIEMKFSENSHSHLLSCWSAFELCSLLRRESESSSATPFGHRPTENRPPKPKRTNSSPSSLRSLSIYITGTKNTSLHFGHRCLYRTRFRDKTFFPV